MLHWLSLEIGRTGVFVRIDPHSFVYIASITRTPTDPRLRLRKWFFALSRLESILAVVRSVKPTFLVVDGVTASNLASVEEFRGARCERTVFVTSSGYYKKSEGREGQFTYAAWSEDELKSAWTSLRDLVWQQEEMDAPAATDHPMEKRSKPITEEGWASFFSEKFFYAGYSGRWFFKRSIRLVKRAVETNIGRLDSVTGDKTTNLVAYNHLFFASKDSGPGSTPGVVVSVYAQRRLADSSGAGAQALWIRIQGAAGEWRTYRAVDGWVLEALILQCLRQPKPSVVHEGTHAAISSPLSLGPVFTLACRVLDAKEETRLTGQCIRYFDELEDIKVGNTLPNRSERKLDTAWFIPLKFNQGGYDLVHVAFSKPVKGEEGDGGLECQVTFFRITVAQSHDIKWEYMTEFLGHLCSVLLSPDKDESTKRLLDLELLRQNVKKDPLPSFLTSGEHAEYMFPDDVPEAVKTARAGAKGTARVFGIVVQEQREELAKRRSPAPDGASGGSADAAAAAKRPRVEEKRSRRWPLLSRRRIFDNIVTALCVNLIVLCPDASVARSFTVGAQTLTLELAGIAVAHL